MRTLRDKNIYITFASSANFIKETITRKFNKILVVTIERHNLTSEEFLQKVGLLVFKKKFDYIKLCLLSNTTLHNKEL